MLSAALLNLNVCEIPNAARSPFAAQTETFQIHPEPPAGGGHVYGVISPSALQSQFLASVRVHDAHHAPEGIHTDGDKSLFPLGGVIFDRERQGIVQDAIALRQCTSWRRRR